MNDNKTYIETEDELSDTLSEALPEPDIPVKQKKPKKVLQKPHGDMMAQLIPALSSLILLFTIILTVAVALINAPVTPTKPNSGTVYQPTENIVAVTDYRAKITPPNAKSTIASAEYKPSGIGAGISGDAIGSSAALLVDYKSANGTMKNNVISSLSADEQVCIASMTKVMTLIVCCDYISAAEEDVFYRAVTLKNNVSLLDGYSCAFVGKVDVNNNYENTTIAQENVYIIDMLYALILQSGADCAYGLAEFFSGSESAFVTKMNEKAQALGMTGTVFTNCVGKDDGGRNHSTVRDVATMFAYALDNDLCYNILTARSWECIGKYRHQTIPSLVLDTVPNNNRNYGSVTILGGKSGNETMARYCLVTVGQTKSGAKFICVTANSGNSYNDTAFIFRNYIV